MEKLEFEFRGRGEISGAPKPALVGVVASGNLEVLVEQASLAGSCRVVVNTSARGFGKIWQAVLEDFFNRHALSDVVVSINDAGATPAIVSLRLDQALEEFRGRRHESS